MSGERAKDEYPSLEELINARMGRRRLLQVGAGAALSMGLAACGLGGGGADGDTERVVEAEIDGDLVYFNWAQYLDPKLIKEFEDRHGVKVKQSNFDSMQGMMAKLRAGNQYDLIFPSAEFVQRLNEADQLLRIDRDQLKNRDQIYSVYDDPWYDPGSEHSVPYSLYVTGIGYRSDKIDNLEGSWRDLVDPRAEGRNYVLDDFQEAIGMANLVNGFDLNTVNPDELDVSKDYLVDIKSQIRGFSSDTITNMASGNAWIQHLWNGDIVNIRNQVSNPEDFQFETCKEGLPVGIDTFAIPVNAEHPGTALLFIDFMLDPENASRNIQYTGYPEPNKGTEATFKEMVDDDPNIALTVEQVENGEQYVNLKGEGRELWDRVWTEVKAA